MQSDRINLSITIIAMTTKRSITLENGTITEGIAFPCPHALLTQWTPAKERSTLSALAVSGNFVGFAMALPISGFLVDHVGWEAVFYILGILYFH
ncbi:hypothetical protein C0J52_25344 [Blattella germanica]|nr:hypothetical protein C0J52_25344 [Blattella germanica]